MSARSLLPVLAATLLVTACGLTGCSSSSSNSDGQSGVLTPGMVKKTIERGKTSQTDVLEVFGSPDMVTSKDGMEVWTYERTRHEVETTGSYLTVILAGGSTQKTTSSGNSTMLILYFQNEIVREYRLQAIKY